MRLLVVLALVAFTGCQAHVLRSDEPQSQLELVKDSFWGYLEQARQSTQDVLQTIRESELGQQVSTKLNDGVEVARQYAVILHDQASVNGQELYTKVSEHVEWVSERLQQDFKEVQAQMEPYTEPLRANIEEQVEKVRQGVAPYAQELTWNVEQYLKEFQQNLVPLTEAIQKEMTSKAKHVQEKLAPYTEDLKDSLSYYVEAIRSQVNAFKKNYYESA